MRPEDLPLHMKILTAGVAGCTADVASYPLDTVKVWQQINGEKSTAKKSNIKTKAVLKAPSPTKSTTRTLVSKASQNSAASFNSLSRPFVTAHTISLKSTLVPKNSPSQNGIISTLLKVVRTHGVKGLYSGLPAGLQRQLGFCSIRIGLYDTIKNYYVTLFPSSRDSKLIGHSVLAGCTTGFVAVAMFQPTEVVKIRMQASGGVGTLEAYKHLFRGGIKAGWQGYETNCARMMVVNVCEIVTYDIVKSTFIRNNIMRDGLPCHLNSALISGFITTLIASPIDVVKTRFTNSKKGEYKSPLQCAARTFAKEGAKAFYKGFLPSYLRIGSWNVLMFVGFEQYKRICCNTYVKLRADLPVHTDKYSRYEVAMFDSLLECGPMS